MNERFAAGHVRRGGRRGLAGEAVPPQSAAAAQRAHDRRRRRQGRRRDGRRGRSPLADGRSTASSSPATATARRRSASRSSRPPIPFRTPRGKPPPARFSTSSRAWRRTISCCASFRAAAPRCSPCPTAASRSPTSRRSIARCCSSGAHIGEINCVRKHLSAIKGGRLALAAAPARVVSLIISDVPGDDLSVIASGPTAPMRPRRPTRGRCSGAIASIRRPRCGAARGRQGRDAQARRSALRPQRTSHHRDAARLARGRGRGRARAPATARSSSAMRSRARRASAAR